MSDNLGKDALKDSIKNQALDDNNQKDVDGNNNPSDETTREKLPLDDATSDKSNKKTNQSKDVLMNSTTNQAPEKNIHKDIEDGNDSNDKASNNKMLPDDATCDKSNQNNR